jgi:hypothetical protein
VNRGLAPHAARHVVDWNRPPATWPTSAALGTSASRGPAESTMAQRKPWWKFW